MGMTKRAISNLIIKKIIVIKKELLKLKILRESIPVTSKGTPPIERRYMCPKGTKSRNGTPSGAISDLITASYKHVFARSISRLKFCVSVQRSYNNASHKSFAVVE